MPKYTLFYRGGKPRDLQQAQARQPSWDAWFRTLGSKLIDRGAPARSIGLAGHASPFSELLPPTTGYSVIEAQSEDEALQIAATCPIYGEGGAVEVARYIQPSKL